ncbi:hypothetical protein ACQ4M3_20905 [Leptolyngbya sp. AN03gr2]
MSGSSQTSSTGSQARIDPAWKQGELIEVTIADLSDRGDSVSALSH